MPDDPGRSAFYVTLRTIWCSLTTRLVIVVIALLTIGTSMYSWYSLKIAEAGWEQTIEACALRLSDMVVGATHLGMLENQKEYVHHTIRRLASAPGLEGIRVYDKEGIIIFSDDPSEISKQVDLQAEACVICHDSDEPLRSPPLDDRVRKFRLPGQHRVLGLISPIQNTSECATGACHFHPESQTVLGVLDVRLSLDSSDKTLYRMQRGFLVAVLATTLVIVGALVIFIDRQVRVPIQRLIATTERVAQGDLNTRIVENSSVEFSQFARAFNKMTDDLYRAREENLEWSRTLEQKVIDKTEELRRTQRQMVHMEKMASLGKLAATVAHELNNPLAGILTYAKLVRRSLRDAAEDVGVPAAGAGDRRDADASLVSALGEFRPSLDGEELVELLRYLSVIEKESGRCGDIVRNLLLFSRYSGADLAEHELSTIVDRAAMLVQHHLQMTGVTLAVVPLEGNDAFTCDGNQIQQALVALLINAVEAMPSRGSITIRCRGDESWIQVEVADTGPGIPPAVLPNIFEPFFSTKENTEGVGLGLAVVYGIVQRHGGSITVDSHTEPDPNHGTSFNIRLPRHPPTLRDGGSPVADIVGGRRRPAGVKS